MKSKILLMLFFILGCVKIYAQKYKLDNVTIEELQEKVCPKDADAGAAILFEKGRTYFDFNQSTGFSLITEVETKIKIYKKKAMNGLTKPFLYT